MLSVVATPIGNLGDITLRAIETLKKCDAIVCEDTRHTGNLLTQLGLPKKPLISFHSYNEKQKLTSLISHLTSGQHLAIVSDAGTPGISDPGFVLVSAARKQGVPIEVVPGPSAFLAALSSSGLPINHFRYLGFLPQKKGRHTLLISFREAEETIVFYESVHRIERTLKELAEVLNDQPNRTVVIARELTKFHEEVVSTTIVNLSKLASTITKKGEFVIILGPKNS